MDTLSEVLRAIRLTGGVYFSVDGSAPWVVESLSGREIAPYFGGVEHVISYHVITAGSCWTGPVEGARVRLQEGDVIVFPRGDAHRLASEADLRGRADVELYRAANQQTVPLCLSLQGGGPERVQIVCGFLGCDAHPFNPLLAGLPRMIHLPGTRLGASGARALIDLALAESRAPRPGSQGVLSRLSELLFVDALRFFSDALPPDQAGWFAGLRDPLVGAALARLHGRPTEAWTLQRLGREIGASRSVLAERFTRLVGIPAMQYLARWRVQMAAGLLRSTDHGLAEIAATVGYSSEAALSRAFKRALGTPPARYRSSAVCVPDARLHAPDAR